MCSSCSHMRHTDHRLWSDPLQLSWYLRFKHHLQIRQKRHFMLQEKHTTIFCIMRGQEIYLPVSDSHEELNSQAQVKEPTFPIAWESHHFTATWKGTQSHIHWNRVLYFIFFPLSVPRTWLWNQLNSKSGYSSQKADDQGFLIFLILRWWWEILWRYFTDGTTNNRAQMERAELSPTVHRYRERN